MALEALALEYMNDRYRDNGCGRIEAGMDGEAMCNRMPEYLYLAGSNRMAYQKWL